MEESKDSLKDARIAVEVVNHAVLLHIPQEHGKGVKVIFGGADGVLVTMDAAGHIHVLPPQGPGDPQVRKAVASIVQGIQLLGQLSTSGAAGVAA